MISVIIPCYNSEKTIKKCIDSVLNQTYENFEIILINDGSKDNTDKIIKTYSDKRIRYYDNENQGIGKTRNFGIKEATGDYITFLDSDDYLDKNALKNFYECAASNDLDLVISNYYMIGKNKQEFIIGNFDITTLKESPNLLYDINLSPWNKLYKSELIKNIEFIENLKYEDAPFVINAMINAKKIGKLNSFTHYYVVNDKSETTIRDERIFDIFKILDIIHNDTSKYDYLNEIYKELAIRIVCNYNIQQRYQKNIKIASRFIDKGFSYMKSIDSNYKSNKYFKTRSVFKRIIEKNKMLTKLYCFVHILI